MRRRSGSDARAEGSERLSRLCNTAVVHERRRVEVAAAALGDDHARACAPLAEETRGIVDRTLADLPARQRAVLTLRDIEGLDAADACNILGVTETNQRVLLHRARARVRAALERHLSRP